MAADPLAKVRPGQPLRIPASAYNAFVDAAKFSRGVREDTLRDAKREQTRALTPVRNNSGATIPRFGVLGVDAPLFDPLEAPDGFKRRTALIGTTPSEVAHAGKFVITLEPIAPGAIGMACAAGLCAAHVEFPVDPPGSERERRFADVADGVSGNLKAGDRGAATILWKEVGTGVKWAIVRLGGLAESRQFPVALTQTIGFQGTATLPATWFYDVADAITGDQLAQTVSPVAAPHTWRRPPVGPVRIATFGSAHFDTDGALVLDWINEVPEPMWAFPITLAQTGGLDGDTSTPATWTYVVTDATSGITLATNVDPTTPPHEWKRPPAGKMTPATHGYASLSSTGLLVIGWINELPDIPAVHVFPVSLALAELANGTDTIPTNHMYHVFDAATGAQLNDPLVLVNPGQPPHHWKRPSIGRYAPATFGLAYRDAADNVIITWTNEVPELEACAAAGAPPA